MKRPFKEELFKQMICKEYYTVNLLQELLEEDYEYWCDNFDSLNIHNMIVEDEVPAAVNKFRNEGKSKEELLEYLDNIIAVVYATFIENVGILYDTKLFINHEVNELANFLNKLSNEKEVIHYQELLFEIEDLEIASDLEDDEINNGFEFMMYSELENDLINCHKFLNDEELMNYYETLVDHFADKDILSKYLKRKKLLEDLGI